MAKNRNFDINDNTKSPARLIFLLAWPVFLEQIFTTLVSYADTAMVGALGKNATASVSISNSPIFLMNGVIMALGVGITTLVAQATGAGEKALVKKLIRHAIMIILYLGIPITAVIALLHRAIPQWMGADPEILDTAAQYNLIVSAGRLFALMSMTLNSVFRGYGDTRTPLKANLTTNIVNVIGNYFLINPTHEVTLFKRFSFMMPGAGWGVAGAAAATAISMFIGGMFTLLVAFFRKNGFEVSLKESYRIDWKLMKKIFRISLPAMLERIFMSSSGIFVTRSVATLGTASVAANSLALTAESMSFMPGFAFQMATTTLVGQSIGANRIDRAKVFTRTTCLIATIVMLFTGAVLFLFAPQLLSIFTPDAEVIEIGSAYLRVVGFLQVPQVLCWVLGGALRGAGDTKYNFYITAATNWGIRTLFSIIAIRVLGMQLVAIAYICIIEGVVRLALLYVRYRRGKWIEIGQRMNAEKISA
ncbi:MAG: MATE family efflux transporter [Clostridia bacterium]|nr:MATE family efflux transporter [Clostridia bacterium]